MAGAVILPELMWRFFIRRGGWTINSQHSVARLRYRKDHYLIVTSSPECQNFIPHARSNAYLQE
jgi:hypothetical protein